MTTGPLQGDADRRRRTRIVATLGPASSSPETIAALCRAGVNVFRLNFSHGSQADHRLAAERVRAVAAGEPIALLADLCGPKLRVGTFPGGGIDLVAGQSVIITTRDVPGGPGLIRSQYATLARDARPGDRVLLDDGLIELRVARTADDELACEVVAGGRLRDRKGMHLPGVAISAAALTDKDRGDARFALELGVDFFALSFVRRPDDVADLRRLLTEQGAATPIIAKIEKPEALTQIDAILDAADGVMVARGDLGVEMPPETVPIVQRDLVARARWRGKPVLVATQMLESMIGNARPTRAEVSDVSGAVFSGADGVMLSGETAVGAHPVAAVAMMDRVAREVESWQAAHGAFRSITDDDPELPPPLSLHRAIARSTAQLSRDLRVRAVVVRTTNGETARAIAATRPAAPILALSKNPAICRRLGLVWGVTPRCVSADEFDRPHACARRLAVESGLAGAGDFLLLVAGFGKREPSVTVLPV